MTFRNFSAISLLGKMWKLTKFDMFFFSSLRCINIWSISVRNNKSWRRPYCRTTKSHGQPSRIQHVTFAATASKSPLELCCSFFFFCFVGFAVLLIHTSTRDNDHNHDVRNKNEPSSISSMGYGRELWPSLLCSKSSEEKKKWENQGKQETKREEEEVITEIIFYFTKIVILRLCLTLENMVDGQIESQTKAHSMHHHHHHHLGWKLFFLF